jgi:hypothetical protein
LVRRGCCSPWSRRHCRFIRDEPSISIIVIVDHESTTITGIIVGDESSPFISTIREEPTLFVGKETAHFGILDETTGFIILSFGFSFSLFILHRCFRFPAFVAVSPTGTLNGPLEYTIYIALLFGR